MTNLEQLLERDEDVDLEFKSAQGADGKGVVPRSLWETYSAMANTEGGVIYMGVKQEGDEFFIEGIKSPAHVQKFFWDSVNNAQVVSSNILRDQDVQVEVLNGLSVVSIRVPRAKREERPIFVGLNPFSGTYKRNFEGDYKCNRNSVQRMIAEATERSRDERILPNYELSDLDQDSLLSFRALFRTTNATHPFLAKDDLELLRSLGGWRCDRQTGEEGLTVAGLLMFGQQSPIWEEFPALQLDYRELPSDEVAGGSVKWLDRFHSDGSWSGNLFIFFRRVLARLTAELKVPYRIEGSGQRIDESPIHEALREALVNTLIHADFSGRTSVLVIKKPGEFSFQNPGNLRLPLHTVLAGGQSDCRNPWLQRMFQMIGAAEKAGSGIPKILRAWQEQHWRFPLLWDEHDPEQTHLSLPMASLLPERAIQHLRDHLGKTFDSLDERERIAVVTAHIEGKISNARLRSVTGLHSADCSILFKGLVSRKILQSSGSGRWTTYKVDGDEANSEPVLDLNPRELSTDPRKPNSLGSVDSSLGFVLSSEERKRLEDIAAPVSSPKKPPQSVVRNVILQICRDHFFTSKEVGELLGRSAENLQQTYLSSLVKEGLLERRFPLQPNHPEQAYRTSKSTQIT